MTDIEDLERWHRQWEQGIDPDHDCRANTEWVDITSMAGWASRPVYGPCTVCGETPEPMVVEPVDPKPGVNRKKLAGLIGGIVYYVLASLLLMQVPDVSVMAWIFVPLMSLAAWLLIMIVISLFWDLLGWLSR